VPRNTLFYVTPKQINIWFTVAGMFHNKITFCFRWMAKQTC